MSSKFHRIDSDDWVGFDLDGTLAVYDGWNDGVIGEPIPAMIDLVRQFLADGVEVRIVTARVSSGQNAALRTWQHVVVSDWCLKHIGQRLGVTCEKDFHMAILFDDGAIQVQTNTGEIVG